MITIPTLQHHYKRHIRPFLEDEGKNWAEMTPSDIAEIARHYLRTDARCRMADKPPCGCTANCGDDESFHDRQERINKAVAAITPEQFM